MQARYVIGLAPAFVIAIANWFYRILLFERYRGVCSFSRVEVAALAMFICGGFAAWVGTMCIQQDLIALQFFAAFYRCTVNWVANICIVNERVVVSRQQLIAYAFTLVITFLWEVQSRVILT